MYKGFLVALHVSQTGAATTRAQAVSATCIGAKSRPTLRALHMSYTVRAATATAVSASISTPVALTVRTRAVIITEWLAASRARSTAALVSGSGWHSGISADVCFAPMMPAGRGRAVKAVEMNTGYDGVHLGARQRAASSRAGLNERRRLLGAHDACRATQGPSGNVRSSAWRLVVGHHTALVSGSVEQSGSLLGADIMQHLRRVIDPMFGLYLARAPFCVCPLCCRDHETQAHPGKPRHIQGTQATRVPRLPAAPR